MEEEGRRRADGSMGSPVRSFFLSSTFELDFLCALPASLLAAAAAAPVADTME